MGDIRCCSRVAGRGSPSSHQLCFSCLTPCCKHKQHKQPRLLFNCKLTLLKMGEDGAGFVDLGGRQRWMEGVIRDAAAAWWGTPHFAWVLLGKCQLLGMGTGENKYWLPACLWWTDWLSLRSVRTNEEVKMIHNEMTQLWSVGILKPVCDNKTTS